MLSVKARFTVGALTLGGGGLSEYRTGRTAAVRFVHAEARPARRGYTNYRGFGFPSLQSSFGTRPTGRSAVRPRRTMAFGRLQELLPGHL